MPPIATEQALPSLATDNTTPSKPSLSAHLATVPLPLTKVQIEFDLLPERRAVEARCTVKTSGVTGVEMEALTGVSTALLTIYDMCKAVDKGMELGEIHLVEKTGGKSGHYIRAEGGYV